MRRNTPRWKSDGMIYDASGLLGTASSGIYAGYDSSPSGNSTVFADTAAKGDVTTSSRKISFPFYRTIPASEIVGSEHALKTELWVCDAETAPDKRDNSVRKLCVMLSEPIPVEKFVKMRNEKGDVFYRVDYSLDMTVTGGVVVYEMSLQGKLGREKVGRVEVTYE